MNEEEMQEDMKDDEEYEEEEEEEEESSSAESDDSMELNEEEGRIWLNMLHRFLQSRNRGNEEVEAEELAVSSSMIEETDDFLSMQSEKFQSQQVCIDVQDQTGFPNFDRVEQVFEMSRGNTRHYQSRMGGSFLPPKRQVLDRYSNMAFCGKYSKSGDLFMSACQDRHIRLYDTSSWRVVKDISAEDVGWSIISVDYAPDDRWVIYSSWSPFVHLYNTRGAPLYEPLDFEPRAQRFCLFASEFSPNSTEILGGASDHNVYLYDLTRKQLTHRFAAHDNDVNAIAYVDDAGQLFASGSDDRLIKLWDRRLVSSAKPLSGCVGAFVGHTKGVTCLSARGDNRYFLSNGKDHCAKLWDTRAALQHNDALDALRDLPQTWYDYRDRVRVRNGERQRRHELDTSLQTYRGGHRVFRTLLRAHFSPLASTGSRYVIAGSDDGCVCIYETLTGKVVERLAGHDAVVRDVSWHPHKSELISTSWDGSCGLWSFAEHKQLSERNEQQNFSIL